MGAGQEGRMERERNGRDFGGEDVFKRECGSLLSAEVSNSSALTRTLQLPPHHPIRHCIRHPMSPPPYFEALFAEEPDRSTSTIPTSSIPPVKIQGGYSSSAIPPLRDWSHRKRSAWRTTTMAMIGASPLRRDSGERFLKAGEAALRPALRRLTNACSFGVHSSCTATNGS